MTEHKVSFTFEGGEGFTVDCREDEDVVTAALRQGFILLTECREGTCSTCKGYLAEGDYDELLTHSVHALSPSEEEEGWVLACWLQPRSDMLVEYDYPFHRVERFADGARQGRIVSCERLSDTVVRLVVKTLEAQPAVTFDPGQYVRLTLRSVGVTRDYSMASLPPGLSGAGGGRDLEFLIRVMPDGAFSGWVAAEDRRGELVDVEGPFGLFTLRTGTGRTPVMVAGGTGLAPILSMLRSLGPDDEARLFFGNTNPGDVFGDADLAALPAGVRVSQALVNAGPGWAGTTGLVTDALSAEITEPLSHDYYLCGPPPMVAAARALLEGWGVPAGQVFEERFTPSGGES